MNELLSSLNEKTRQFIEISYTLFLDFCVTVLVWLFKMLIDLLPGFVQMQQNDTALQTLMSFSAYALYSVLSFYIVGDIFKQGLKTYTQIKQQFKELKSNT